MNTENLIQPISNKRIERDLLDIHIDGGRSPIIFAAAVDGNVRHIETAINGPMSTPYENGIFLLDIKLLENFPFSPPQSITFKRAIMHPNVTEYGKFMSNLLKPETWVPSMTIKDILEHIWARLAFPDVDSDECDLTRAHSYKTDKQRFEEIAHDYAVKYAQAT